MAQYDNSDTIAAISSALGVSGIGIVRISGRDALKVADRVFLSKDGVRPSSFKTYTVHYGWILETQDANPMHADRQGKIEGRKVIDEVIMTVMRAPKSYTKEDVVEINCHGGIVALRSVLELVLKNGCRLSESGEFTRRAFLNGRIDLTQAEAVLDIIQAKTDSALRLGAEQLRGVLSLQIKSMRRALLDILSSLEAHIDFPDDGIDALDVDGLNREISAANNKLKDLAHSLKYGRIIREGIHMVICGRPNVGKSSLLNALLKEERSIVTPIAGTTRDTIEEVIDIRGIPVRIVDTAGIIEPRDLIEKKAVARSRRHIASADLVLLMFDGNRRLNKEDEALIRKLKVSHVIAVINKIDMKQHIQKDRILKEFGSVVDISAKRLKNIGILEEAVVNSVYAGHAKPREPSFAINARHGAAIKKAQKLVEDALNSLDNKLSLEFIAQDIKDALSSLDDIMGERVTDDLLDRIFSNFCIGK